MSEGLGQPGERHASRKASKIVFSLSPLHSARNGFGTNNASALTLRRAEIRGVELNDVWGKGGNANIMKSDETQRNKRAAKQGHP